MCMLSFKVAHIILVFPILNVSFQLNLIMDLGQNDRNLIVRQDPARAERLSPTLNILLAQHNPSIHIYSTLLVFEFKPFSLS